MLATQSQITTPGFDLQPKADKVDAQPDPEKRKYTMNFFCLGGGGWGGHVWYIFLNIKKTVDSLILCWYESVVKSDYVLMLYNEINTKVK